MIIRNYHFLHLCDLLLLGIMHIIFQNIVYNSRRLEHDMLNLISLCYEPYPQHRARLIFVKITALN